MSRDLSDQASSGCPCVPLGGLFDHVELCIPIHVNKHYQLTPECDFEGFSCSSAVREGHGSRELSGRTNSGIV